MFVSNLSRNANNVNVQNCLNCIIVCNGDFSGPPRGEGAPALAGAAVTNGEVYSMM